MGIPSPQLQNLKAEFLRALAHPIRIQLLEVLVTRDETSVQELQRALGIDQPIVSQQLARLRASSSTTRSLDRSAPRGSPPCVNAAGLAAFDHQH